MGETHTHVKRLKRSGQPSDSGFSPGYASYPNGRLIHQTLVRVTVCGSVPTGPKKTPLQTVSAPRPPLPIKYMWQHTTTYTGSVLKHTTFPSLWWVELILPRPFRCCQRSNSISPNVDLFQPESVTPPPLEGQRQGGRSLCEPLIAAYGSWLRCQPHNQDYIIWSTLE